MLAASITIDAARGHLSQPRLAAQVDFGAALVKTQSAAGFLEMMADQFEAIAFARHASPEIAASDFGAAHLIDIRHSTRRIWPA